LLGVLAGGGIYLNNLEVSFLFGLVASLICAWSYGIYWTVGYILQVVSLWLCFDKFPYSKRVATAIAVFFISHGAMEDSILVALGYTVSWCIVSFFLAIAFQIVASLDSQWSDDTGPRKVFVTKAQMRAAKQAMAAEAKAEAVRKKKK
jgi:hypothetical protein